MIALIAFTVRLAAAEPEDLAPDPVSRSEAAESASFDPGWSDVGVADDREAARHAAPTRIGRIDLTVTWRRTLRVAEMRATDATLAIASPLDPETTARGVLWVLLTWSR